MKKRINVRLVGIAVLAIISTVIGITFVYYNLLVRQVRADLAVSAKLLRNVDIDKIDLSNDLEDLHVTWLDTDGTVLYDNGALDESMHEDTIYYVQNLNNGTVLRLATNAHSIWAVFVSAIPIIFSIVVLVILICVVISHFLTRQLLRPIEQMVENLENADYKSPYRELDPVVGKLRVQHADILASIKAKQDFTANVSHELKTPLTAISGYAELLDEGMVDQNQQNHLYQEIRKNADRMLAMIDDTLRLSDLDNQNSEVEFAEVDLYEAAEECMETLSVYAKQQDVSLQLEGASQIIWANENMIKELIENLVQNGIRYNNPGGYVKISVAPIHGQPALTVEDNGIGIPVSQQDRIFERFYRVDKSRSKATGGTGLGLAIVKHIVEIHDAVIDIDSAVGEGTRISVMFTELG